MIDLNPPLKRPLILDSNHPSLTPFKPETIQTFELGYCSRGEMEGRIVIPIRNPNGPLVGYAGCLPGEQTFIFTSGFNPSLELWNLDKAKMQPADNVLIVVQGFLDALRLHELGHAKVVAWMGGKMSPTQADLILQATNQSSRILLMLKESRIACAEMTIELSKIAFTRVHPMNNEGLLTEEEFDDLFI